jgi:hypothetical protein
MPVLHCVSNFNDNPATKAVSFKCPGCACAHVIPVAGTGVPIWTFNGSMEKPTFSPSILVKYYYVPNEVDPRNGIHQLCHSFVLDGNIQFLTDCTHKLAGQTVPLPQW